jgi:cell division protein FtsI (penicillin-binding protein 3)
MRAVIPHNRAVPIREKYLSDSRNALRSNALSRGRSRLVGAAFPAGFVALVVRAFWVQTINDGFYRQQGELRQVRELPVHGSRGRIHDRSGRPLAVSLPMRTLWIDA